MEWQRHTAMRDVAVAQKRRQKAREHAGKAREHLDKMENIGETNTYRRVVCLLESEMFSNGKRQRKSGSQ
jgi:hypothetical protein